MIGAGVEPIKSILDLLSASPSSEID